MRSSEGQFTASACHFVHWDNRGVGSPAIQVDAGRTIVQGCTFSQENLHVALGSNVVSAILTANQASGGFQVANQAGRRAQIALNEEDPIEWTSEARAHYRLEIGGAGDGRYLQGWHGRERGDRPFRWSMGSSFLLLPVAIGQAYTIEILAAVPQQAVSAEAGLYHEGKRIAPLTNGLTISAALPVSNTPRLRLELRCGGWVPQRVMSGSADPRTLGVQGFAVTMRAANAGARVFSANTGRWIESQEAGRK
jgi:hypothetical protein